MGHEDMEDLREVLKVAREEVPGLLKDITGPVKELLNTVFTVTEEEAESKAKAIAKFYNELVKAGIEKDTALEMTKGNFVSPADILKELSKLEKVGNIHIEQKKK